MTSFHVRNEFWIGGKQSLSLQRRETKQFWKVRVKMKRRHWRKRHKWCHWSQHHWRENEKNITSLKVSGVGFQKLRFIHLVHHEFAFLFDTFFRVFLLFFYQFQKYDLSIFFNTISLCFETHFRVLFIAFLLCFESYDFSIFFNTSLLCFATHFRSYFDVLCLLESKGYSRVDRIYDTLNLKLISYLFFLFILELINEILRKKYVKTFIIR